jgi:ribosomal-protein-alanine N-acetyltransferase
MTLGDVDAVAAIERETFAMPWSYASFVRELTQNASTARYLVLDLDGEAVGYAGMWLVVDEGHVTNIAVRSDLRGMGGGKELMRALIGEAAANGLAYMALEVRRSNAAARGLYQKMGFVDAGVRKRYYEDNREDAMIMAREDLPKALGGGGIDAATM